MACEYCLRSFGHDYRCPNYVSSRASHYCSVCDEGIYNGEEYIVNDDGDYAHWECISYGRDLVKFLGYKIQKIEDY